MALDALDEHFGQQDLAAGKYFSVEQMTAEDFPGAFGEQDMDMTIDFSAVCENQVTLK